MNIESSSLPKLALIAGPTASGKSALAIALAERMNGTVINADSAQVYREIRVLSARPTPEEMRGIEHRLFAYISQNWRGKPLVSHQVIIQLIGATTTDTGLTVTCDIDAGCYPKGIKVSDAEMDAINIERHTFHGDWNYTIKPVPTQQPP